MGLGTRFWHWLGGGAYDEVAVVARVVAGGGGTMIDVGAHHGSAAQHFVDRGWRVFAFEPDPANRAVLQERLGDRIEIDPRAVTDHSGDAMTLYTSSVSTGISTLSAFHESHVATTTVSTVTLADFLAASGLDAVRVLKVDTEGHDLFVLRGMDWSRRPEAVVCEFEDRKTEQLGYRVADLAELLLGLGYAVLVSEWFPIVEYGQRHRWRRIVRWPVDLAPNSWGNLIAVEPGAARRVLRAGRAEARRLRRRLLAERVLRRG